MSVMTMIATGCDGIIENLREDAVTNPRTSSMSPGFPAHWGGFPMRQFEVGLDHELRRSGRYSSYIRTTTRGVLEDQFGLLVQSVRADAYRGSRIRLSGWINTVNLTGNGVGLWLRGDGPGDQPFDNMNTRRLTGTSTWREASIVVDVPESTIGLTFGVIMHSPGTVWIDDLKLETVGPDVPVTGAVLRATGDTAVLAATYDRIPMGPRNLEFEGTSFPGATIDAVAFVKNNSFAFVTDDPAVPSTDLEPLRALVGDASIVALGEATHGTREFFRMKHRVLEWLVREKGFSYFGIEATFPEALDVDRYVQTGEGDPSLLLARLFFWTWNTDEVLDLIKWMRSWNAAGNTPRVHFVGFDMQFPGAALDSVENVAKRMSAADGAEVDAAYECLNQFRTFPSQTGSAGVNDFRDQTPQYQADCQLAIQRVDTLLARREAEWGAREGIEKARLVRRYGRLVSQWIETNIVTTGSFFVRDRSMAENVAWWHDSQAPGAKIVLWAHNMHIARIRNHMGHHLGRMFGARYLSIGQTFGSGTFNAVRLGAPIDTLPPLRSHMVASYRDESIESVFLNTGLPRLIFDARRVESDTTAAGRTLSMPLSIRAIGAGFNPLFNISTQTWPLVLRNDYDLLIWFEHTTHSILRPFPGASASRQRNGGSMRSSPPSPIPPSPD